MTFRLLYKPLDYAHPDKFLDQYLEDFDKDHGPELLALPWDPHGEWGTTPRWTTRNLNYLDRLGTLLGFHVACEWKKADMLWFDIPLWKREVVSRTIIMALETHLSEIQPDTEPVVAGVQRKTP